VCTIPEYLERRFGPAVRSALALCWLLFMAANIGVMLLASARMTSSLLGWNEVACIVVTALLAGTYTAAGGLSAVVYTDVVQCAVMIAGCLVVLVIGLVEIGGPANLPNTQLVLPVDTASPFPWTGILFGLALILSPAYWIGNQAIVQRSLGAKSEFHAKAAYVWGALLKNLIPFLVAVPGLIAAARFPGLANGDDAYPSLVGKLLPHGLRGVFLAAFLAALMSSVDSYLNSAATIFTNDVYQRFFDRGASQRRLLLLGRATTIVLVICGVLLAIGFSLTSKGIYAIFQTLMAFFQGPALAVLMAGLLWRRATASAALVGFVGGVAMAVGLFVLGQEAVYTRLELAPLFQIKEPFLYYSIWAFLTSAALVVMVSLVTQPDDASRTCFTIFGGGSDRGRAPAASIASAKESP
jgi:SSS family solute:Na+ symporter